MSASDQEPTRKFSPFAGCSIFIVVAILAAGMLAFSVWTYFKVKDTIAGFTEETAKSVELVEALGNEAAQTALKEKLIGFRHNIEAKNKAEITLNSDEMNLAIATFDILEPHRRHLYITAIKDGYIEADICYPVKSGLAKDEMHFLNGSITLQPELVEGAAFPRITKIRPDKVGDIPDEFKKLISEALLHPLHKDKEIGPVFKGLSGVEIKNGNLVLFTDPEYMQEGVIPENTQPLLERFMKGFAIVAVIFLAIVALIIILSRRKAKQSNPHT